MSARVRLNGSQLRRLAVTLQGLTQIRMETNVDLSGYSRHCVIVDGHAIGIEWDAELKEYVLDDQVGD